MYCKYCGHQIVGNYNKCRVCGAKVKEDEPTTNQNNQSVVLGSLSIISGAFMPIVGLVCGGVGLSYASKHSNKTGKILSIIGLLISTLRFVRFLLVDLL